MTAPEPVEACETPIADAMAYQQRRLGEMQAAHASPAQITVADWNAAVDALATHYTWGHRPDQMHPQWSWACNCGAEGTAVTEDLMERDEQVHVVGVVLAAARIEVQRG
jgi:hypothetical protein